MTGPREDRRITWQPAQGGSIEVACSLELGFARDLPAGRLRDGIGALIEMRRLLPLVEVERHVQAIDLLDSERKTVARLSVENGKAREPGRSRPWRRMTPIVRVRAVRGYDRPFDQVLLSLDERGLQRVTPQTWRLAARAIEREIGVDPSKFRVPLEPGMPAEAGLRAVYAALLEIVRVHEAGVLADLDSEFLHDYRVAVRRTRALLGQVRKVFPKTEVDRFRKGFAWLGSVTGPCRDLDVFLLELEELPAGSPLSELRDRLARLKLEEHATLVRSLKSSRYRKLLRSWEGLLSAPVAAGTAKNTVEPLLDVIAKRVWKVYEGIVTHKDASSQEDIHELRLAGKKMRYLLDCTRSLYAPDAYEAAVRPLKKLQDRLGDFNDAQVQVAKLTELAQEAEALEPATLLAMGGWIEERRGEARRLQEGMRGPIDKFCSSAIQRRFEELFESARGERP